MGKRREGPFCRPRLTTAAALCPFRASSPSKLSSVSPTQERLKCSQAPSTPHSCSREPAFLLGLVMPSVPTRRCLGPYSRGWLAEGWVHPDTKPPPSTGAEGWALLSHGNLPAAFLSLFKARSATLSLPCLQQKIQ